MKHHGKQIIAISVIALALCVAIMFAMPAQPPRPELDLRMPATNFLLAVPDSQMPASIENSGDGRHIWGIRQTVSDSVIEPAFVAAMQLIADAPNLAQKSLDGADSGGKKGKAGPRNPGRPLFSPLLLQDGSNAPRIFVALPPDYGDALDIDGYPLRWHLPENIIAGYSRFRPPAPEPEAAEESRPQIAVPLRTGDYRALVENFARRYNLNIALVMAIIHSESNFSPNLISSKSAMGLMQLMPSTASDEVHRFLYGRKGNVSFEQLRVPEINIRYGTAYLHILLNRYFQNVKDQEVREYCAIASYNLGPNRFLKLYGPTNEQAVAKINSMDHDIFYADLFARLPARETRYFVQKVRRMKEHYTALK